MWKSRNAHYMTVRCDAHTGAVTWTGHSEWDGPRRRGSRLRNPMSRSTWLPSEAEAKRWAKRYGVELPVAPERKSNGND